MARVLVLTGGGIKGAVTAARYAADHEVILLHADFGQASTTAEREVLAKLVSTFSSARLAHVALPVVTRSGTETGQVGAGSPREAEPSPASLRAMLPVLLSVGVQAASREGATMLATGLSRRCRLSHLGLDHGDPHHVGLREFLHAFGVMMETILPKARPLGLESPLLDLTYDQVIKLAARFGIDLNNTRSCVHAGPGPCHRCERCRERMSAFLEAGIADPLTSDDVLSGA